MSASEVISLLKKLIEENPDTVLKAIEKLRRELSDDTSLAVLSIVEAVVRMRLLSRQSDWS